MEGIDPATIVASAPTLGSPLQHANRLLPEPDAIFNHLYAGDYYDIGANTIEINYVAFPNFIYPFESIFSGLDFAGASLVGVTLAPGSTAITPLVVGFNINFNDITATGFTLNAAIDLQTGVNFTMNLITEPDPAAVIPLPAALPLYGTGLAVMGFLGWRRKRQALRD